MFKLLAWCQPSRSASASPSSTATPAAQGFVFLSSPPPPCRQLQDQQDLHHNLFVIKYKIFYLREKIFRFLICPLQLSIVVCVVEVSRFPKSIDHQKLRSPKTPMTCPGCCRIQKTGGSGNTLTLPPLESSFPGV